MPEKRRPFGEQFALEIAKSQFGVPTLGVLFALAFQVVGLAALLGWTPAMDAKLKTPLTGIQKTLLLISPPLGVLWLTVDEASAIEEDLARAALSPIKLILLPIEELLKRRGRKGAGE